MSLLFKVVFAAKARSTHHMIALDALRHLRGDLAQRWTNLFLKHHDALFEGAKAPDDTFKDFKNHVLHAGENFWGGAEAKAAEWYAKTVDALIVRDWRKAVYSAGVLSHYFADPIQPFHTGQTEEEGAIHRAVEWSLNKSYGEFQTILDADFGGYPSIELPLEEENWLQSLLRRGATLANAQYQPLIDHYDVDKGVVDPPSGLDQEIKDRMAGLVGFAVVGFARILERAFQEAAVEPPVVDVTVRGVIEAMGVPVHLIVKKLDDVKAAAEVKAIYAELQATGRVRDALSDDDKLVRRLHAEEVLRAPLEALDAFKPQPTGTAHGDGAPARKRSRSVRTAAVTRWAPVRPQRLDPASESPMRMRAEPRPADVFKTAPVVKAQPSAPAAALSQSGPSGDFVGRLASVAGATTSRSTLDEARRGPRLTPLSPVVDAPSIGPKTAERLAVIGVASVADLLVLDPEGGAGRLEARHITPSVIREWQAQARLVIAAPSLAGHDAQILTACGVSTIEALAKENAQRLLARATAFARSKPGQRVLQSSAAPDFDEVQGWIDAARRATPGIAA